VKPEILEKYNLCVELLLWQSSFLFCSASHSPLLFHATPVRNKQLERGIWIWTGAEITYGRLNVIMSKYALTGPVCHL